MKTGQCKIHHVYPYIICMFHVLLTPPFIYRISHCHVWLLKSICGRCWASISFIYCVYIYMCMYMVDHIMYIYILYLIAFASGVVPIALPMMLVMFEGTIKSYLSSRLLYPCWIFSTTQWFWLYSVGMFLIPGSLAPPIHTFSQRKWFKDVQINTQNSKPFYQTMLLGSPSVAIAT